MRRAARLERLRGALRSGILASYHEEAQAAARAELERLPPAAVIRALQEELAARGFEPGGCDGRLGAKTRATIADFARGLDPPLPPDAPAWRVLGALLHPRFEPAVPGEARALSVHLVTLRAGARPDVLLFHRLRGREELGRPFRYELEALSRKDDRPTRDLLGTGVTVTRIRRDGSERHLHGLVARAEFLGTDGPYARYGLLLVPWLCFLGRCTDCRIFQDETVPAILEAVMTGWPIADFAIELEGSYRPRDYCVQYRESDLDFLSPPAEEEGISFFFRHCADRHTLVLFDGPGPCTAVPG